MKSNFEFQTFDQRLEHFYSNVQNAIGNDFQDVLEKLNLSPYKKRLSKLPLTHTIRLLEQFNVTLDSVMKGSIDYECLLSQYLGVDNLPGKYLEKVPFSSRYTSIYMLNFVTQEFGEQTTQTIMKHFQIKRSHLQDLASTNNFLLPFDICNYVYEYYGCEMVEKMGQSSFELLANSFNGKRLSQTNGVEDMFELFFEEIAHRSVEKNYFWNIENMCSHKITVAGRPNPEIREAFGSDDKITQEAAHLLRKGFLEMMPALIGDFDVAIETTRKTKFGEVCDLYDIHYRKH
jgi:hypothetical protein